MSKKPDGTRLIHSLNKRRIYNTQIFFQEGNLFLSHPLNCSLLKREVFVQFYFSQCCVMRLLWMIYNQFLWVMFPQWEWSGNEQSHPVLGKALSRFVPLDTCSLFPKRRNLWRAFFKCMRRKWAQRSLVEPLLNLVPCQSKNSCANMAACCSPASFFFFFLRHFFFLGWSVQIVLKVNIEMSKSDFDLSHNRDNSCWTLGRVPNLSPCYGFCFKKKMTCRKLKPNSFRWLIEFLIAKISSDVSVNECQSNNIKRHYLFNDW